MSEEVKEAIKAVIEYGFTVTNEKGGYLIMRYGLYRHQSFYKSTNDFNNFDDAIKSFEDEL